MNFVILYQFHFLLGLFVKCSMYKINSTQTQFGTIHFGEVVQCYEP